MFVAWFHVTVNLARSSLVSQKDENLKICAEYGRELLIFSGTTTVNVILFLLSKTWHPGAVG